MTTSVKHRLFCVATLVLVTGWLSGCSVGSDDADPTSTLEPTVVASATTPSSPVARATATATATIPMTPTPSPAPTNTSVPPTPTRTPTPLPTATATPIPEVPLGNITPLDPTVLTNYSLSAQIEVRGVPNQSDFGMSLVILQAATDLYYLRSTSGATGIESWLVDGTTYLTQADGSVASLPEGSDTALFSPSLLVQTVPTVSGDTLGTPLGNEDVGSRQATHYQIDGEDFIANATWLPGDSMTNVEGQVDVWIDNESGIILRQESNVTWDNADGSAGSLTGLYEITNVTTTAPVAAPG